jgi:hypothetical protein
MTQRFPSVHSRYSIRAPQLQGEPRHTSALHGFNEASFAAGQRAQASHRETAISRDALAWREVLWGMPSVQFSGASAVRRWRSSGPVTGQIYRGRLYPGRR